MLEVASQRPTSTFQSGDIQQGEPIKLKIESITIPEVVLIKPDLLEDKCGFFMGTGVKSVNTTTKLKDSQGIVLYVYVAQIHYFKFAPI